MKTGRIHSIETLGLVDGPGIRTVIFFQGCDLRCKFCHNPDTWHPDGGSLYRSSDLLDRIVRLKPYYKNGGGVTFSGGEPLCQPDFLAQCLMLCKEHGIHTCLDTAGCGYGDYDKILKYTDLVLLDLKEITDDSFFALTGAHMDKLLDFLAALAKNKTKIWIRHVVIPGITDSAEHIKKLREWTDTIPNIERVELLPYHCMGVKKYHAMNYPYPLEDVPEMDKEKTRQLELKYFK